MMDSYFKHMNLQLIQPNCNIWFCKAFVPNSVVYTPNKYLSFKIKQDSTDSKNRNPFVSMVG